MPCRKNGRLIVTNFYIFVNLLHFFSSSSLLDIYSCIFDVNNHFEVWKKKLCEGRF